MFGTRINTFSIFLWLCFGLVIIKWILESSAADHMLKTIVENEQNITSIHPITIVQNITSNYPITIVTAFFQIGEKSKHKVKEYEEWISNFLNRVKCPIVVFTNVQDYISQQINNEQYPRLIFNSSLSDLFVYKKYYRIYEKHYEMDPEKQIHSPELYVIWSSKAYFMNKISNILNPFNSTYFFWVDIGSFRNRAQSVQVLNSVWPDYNRVLYAFSECNQDDNCLIWGLIDKFYKQKRREKRQKICPVFNDHIEGTFMAGTSQSIDWYYEQFFMVHDAFIRKDIFVGKDQNVMNAMVLKNSHHHILLLNTLTAQEHHWNPWFYFQLYFAVNTNVTTKPTYLNNINEDISSLTIYYKSIPECNNVLDI